MAKNKKNWGWSYAAILNEDEEFVLREVYGTDKPNNWTSEPITLFGETPEELVAHLKLAIKDIERGLVFEIKGKKLIPKNKSMKEKCNIPPEGWYCTRKVGHDGPCAAVPKKEK